jgi:SNF2 family DNA or RNA helicase
MLIHRPTKKIVLNVNDPARITTVIPSAKVFQFQGKTLTAIPHRVDEVVVLRNLGYNAPSPIELFYDWPGRFKPFQAQEATASFLTINPRGFVLSEMGTGKTLATLWAWDYLRSIGKANKLLIVGPLSTLECVWASEIFQNMPHLSVAVLHGSKERRLKLLAGDFDVYIVNHHGVEVIASELAKRQDIDTVVVDEVAIYRNCKTKLWKAMNKVCRGRQRLWGLTGTPTPNEPSDAYGQCKLIVPERVPSYFTLFRDKVMQQKSMFKWEPRSNATQVVADAMRPSIRFVRAECMDLPPTMFTDREVALTKEQAEAYRQMLSQLRAELASGSLLAVNEAVKLGKLLQICCGAAYGPKGDTVLVDVSTRINEVLDLIEQAQGKVLVFVPFTSALQQVVDELSKHHKVGMVHGGTSKSARDKIFHEFQKEKSMRVLCANAGTLSHGLTLTAADTSVWFGPPASSEQYQQANARVTRPGQTRSTLIAHLIGSPVEKRIYARLRRRQNLQGLLLDMLTDEEGG